MNLDFYVWSSSTCLMHIKHWILCLINLDIISIYVTLVHVHESVTHSRPNHGHDLPCSYCSTAKNWQYQF